MDGLLRACLIIKGPILMINGGMQVCLTDELGFLFHMLLTFSVILSRPADTIYGRMKACLIIGGLLQACLIIDSLLQACLIINGRIQVCLTDELGFLFHMLLTFPAILQGPADRISGLLTPWTACCERV